MNHLTLRGTHREMGFQWGAGWRLLQRMTVGVKVAVKVGNAAAAFYLPG